MTTVVEPALSPAPEVEPDAATGGRTLWDRLGRGSVMAVLAATLAVLILGIPALALTWQRQPFLVLSWNKPSFSTTSVTTSRSRGRLLRPARGRATILAIDGVPVRTSQDVSRLLAGKAIGQPVQSALVGQGRASRRRSR